MFSFLASSDDQSQSRNVRIESFFAAVRQLIDRMGPAFENHPAMEIAGAAQFPQMCVEIAIGNTELRFQLRKTVRFDGQQDRQTRAYRLVEHRIEPGQTGQSLLLP